MNRRPEATCRPLSRPNAVIVCTSLLCGSIAVTGYIVALILHRPVICALYALATLINTYCLLIGLAIAPLCRKRRATPRPMTAEMIQLEPLHADHPLVQEPRARCIICHEPFKAGDLTTIVPMPELQVHTACMRSFSETYGKPNS